MFFFSFSSKFLPPHEHYYSAYFFLVFHPCKLILNVFLLHCCYIMSLLFFLPQGKSLVLPLPSVVSPQNEVRGILILYL